MKFIVRTSLEVQFDDEGYQPLDWDDCQEFNGVHEAVLKLVSIGADNLSSAVKEMRLAETANQEQVKEGVGEQESTEPDSQETYRKLIKGNSTRFTEIIQTYKQKCGAESVSDEFAIICMVADAMHVAREKGCNFNTEVLKEAEMHFQSEIKLMGEELAETTE